MSKRQFETVATFIAGSGVLGEADIGRALRLAALDADEPAWLEQGVAADVFLADAPADIKKLLEAALAGSTIDVVVQPVARRRKSLLVADMDSTIIGQECIDELADLCGLRDHISRITARAMRGELQFEEALEERVALLAGLKLESVSDVLAERITTTPGARTLVQTMRSWGAYTVLASGGFTLFAEPIAEAVGFDEFRANTLEVENMALTGRVIKPILGAAAKRLAVEEVSAERKLDPRASLAVGDGANDLEMLDAAGLGVAFCAKPKVAAAAKARINHSDLTALLYAQGYRGEDFVD
jgi:phosphoserine phosphatase